MNPRRLSAVAVLAFAVALSARADVKLPAVFSDHLVLHADAPVAVWGWVAR